MNDQALELTVSLQDEEADADRLEQHTIQLRKEISELDVAAVDMARASQMPPRAKGDPATITGIIVSLASAGVFAGLFELLKAWTLRRQGRTITLKAKTGSRQLELVYSPDGTSPEEMVEFTAKIMEVLKQR
jgi:hypothetical protein